MILGTIVGEYELNNFDNKQVENFLYSLKETQSNSDVHSNRKGWQKNELQNMPQLKNLIDAIGEQFYNFIQHELNPISPCKFYLGNMFCNINPTGAYHLPHIHEGDFTGVYYVKAPKNCGNLCLINPHQCQSTAKMTSLFANVKLEEKIEPIEGCGYFFPTYINHYVEENLSDEDRISIFNEVNYVM
jgi:uncharacterized protein (TIGR02466 family)